MSTVRSVYLSQLFYRFALFIFTLAQIINTVLFSGSVEELSLRNVDDNAMQLVVYSIHQSITNWNASGIFFRFDYGYGWIFWITYALASYPLYLLRNFEKTFCEIMLMFILINYIYL
jgi:hypothetical protein